MIRTYKHKARSGEIPQNFSQLTAESKAGISSCAYEPTCFAYPYTGTECIGQTAGDVKSEPRGGGGEADPKAHSGSTRVTRNSRMKLNMSIAQFAAKNKAKAGAKYLIGSISVAA